MHQRAQTRVVELALDEPDLSLREFLFVFMRPLSVEVARSAENTQIQVFGLGTVEARILSKIGFEVGAALVELNGDHGDILPSHVAGETFVDVLDGKKSLTVRHSTSSRRVTVAALFENIPVAVFAVPSPDSE